MFSITYTYICCISHYMSIITLEATTCICSSALTLHSVIDWRNLVLVIYFSNLANLRSVEGSGGAICLCTHCIAKKYVCNLYTVWSIQNKTLFRYQIKHTQKHQIDRISFHCPTSKHTHRPRRPLAPSGAFWRPLAVWFLTPLTFSAGARHFKLSTWQGTTDTWPLSSLTTGNDHEDTPEVA